MNLITNISQLVTLTSAAKKDGRNLLPDDLSIINDAAVVTNSLNVIEWVGSRDSLPKNYKINNAIDLKNTVLTPEIVDSHTHLIFGGNRSHEYTLRLNGADYEAIGKAGGGILNTMRGTNSLTETELFNLCCQRVERIASYGVGSIEIKSGYGLNFDKEYELSHIINKLKIHFAPKGIQIINTFMAAHAIPEIYKSSADYLTDVVIPLLEKLAPEGIIDFVDIFHETGYFDEADTRRLGIRSKELGISFKTHADEFKDNNGAKLACELSAISTDHLIAAGPQGIDSLAASSTIATLLPGTNLFLGKPMTDARRFLDAGCKVSIASDYNPGSCHCDNILLIAAMAAPIYKMNIAELWTAITLNAAHAVNLNDQGAIIPGMKARFTNFEVTTIDEITYNWGRNFGRLLNFI